MARNASVEINSTPGLGSLGSCLLVADGTWKCDVATDNGLFFCVYESRLRLHTNSNRQLLTNSLANRSISLSQLALPRESSYPMVLEELAVASSLSFSTALTRPRRLSLRWTA